MSFVYIMANQGNNKIIKIGYSVDPARRAKELNYSNYGSNYGCLNWHVASKYKSKSGMTAQKLETKAHNLLSEYRIKTIAHSDSELFACTVNHAKSVLVKEKIIKKKYVKSKPVEKRKIINEPTINIYKGRTNYALGMLRCSVTGDEYYYANQKRFNVRTKIMEKLTVEEWRKAEDGYCAPAKKSLFQSIKRILTLKN